MTTSPAVGEGGEGRPSLYAQESKTSDRKHASLTPPSPLQRHAPLVLILGARPCLAFVVAGGTHITSNAGAAMTPQKDIRAQSPAAIIPSPGHAPATWVWAGSTMTVRAPHGQALAGSSIKGDSNPSHPIPSHPPSFPPTCEHSTNTPPQHQSNHGQGSRYQGRV